jgi:abortive phage resistance protein AbiGi (putative antitoxin)
MKPAKGHANTAYSAGKEIASATLFHCWSETHRHRARQILRGICQNGLLLTTNTSVLDGFYIKRESDVEIMEVMQQARVCFTDVPFDRLVVHGARYGKYGVGFDRVTVIEWGGIPAWYVPNHWRDETLKGVGPALINSLHAAMEATDLFRALTQALNAVGIRTPINYVHGRTLEGEELLTHLEQVKNAVYMALSFVKEMSPRSDDDCSFLHEREWRLVAGFNLHGEPGCRSLTKK